MRLNNANPMVNRLGRMSWIELRRGKVALLDLTALEVLQKPIRVVKRWSA
jgi:hypothetical protein